MFTKSYTEVVQVQCHEGITKPSNSLQQGTNLYNQMLAMDKLDAELSIQPVSFLLQSMANGNVLNIVLFLCWKSPSLHYHIK